MNKPKVVIVCGPTATGKSDYAVELAKKINGEIISADSRQVYKGMDIGSGKITKAEMKHVPHYLLDVADPKRVFSVARYKKLAQKAIKDIIKRGKTPIICGGTGYYINAAVFDQSIPEVKPNAKLRKELDRCSLSDLQKRLQKLDPERYESIDIHNPVRLVRAIEIATELGSVPPLTMSSPYDIEWIYLDFPQDVLKERIQKRLVKRMKIGMVKEIERLHAQGVSWKRLESFGLEYRYIAQYLQKKLTKEEMLETLYSEIVKFAKRQRTWFKKWVK